MCSLAVFDFHFDFSVIVVPLNNVIVSTDIRNNFVSMEIVNREVCVADVSSVSGSGCPGCERFHRSNKMQRWQTIRFETDAWITHHCHVICRREIEDHENAPVPFHIPWHGMSATMRRNIILGPTKKALNSTRIKKNYIYFINWCVAGRFGNFYKVWPLKPILVSLVSISDTEYIRSQYTRSSTRCYRFVSCTTSHFMWQFGKHLHAANIQMSWLVFFGVPGFRCVRCRALVGAVLGIWPHRCQHCHCYPLRMVCESIEHRKTEEEKKTDDIRTNTELIFFQIKYKWLYRILHSYTTMIEVAARELQPIYLCPMIGTQSRVFLLLCAFLYSNSVVPPIQPTLALSVFSSFRSISGSSDEIRSGKEMIQIRFYGFISPKWICLAGDFARLNEFINKRNTNKNWIHVKSILHVGSWLIRKMTDDRY